MSLPDPWVARIFDRLTLVYGARFTSQWDARLIDEVKALWASELAGFQQNPAAISFALENLPATYPPTVLEFRAICGRRPVMGNEGPSVQRGKFDPSRLAAAMAKLDGPRKGPLAWAEKLRARHEAGEPLTLAQIRAYRSVL